MEIARSNIRILFLLLIFFSGNRLLFYSINLESFSLDHFSEIFSIIKGGFYYDYCILFLFWTVYWIGLLCTKYIPREAVANKIFSISFLLLLVLYTLLNFTGAIFYKYNFELPSNRTLGIIWKNRSFGGSFIRSYMAYIVTLATLFILVIFFYWKNRTAPLKRLSLNSTNQKVLGLFFLFLATIGFFLIKEKNGSGIISPSSSFRFVKTKYRDLIINPVFNLSYSIVKKAETSDHFINLLENVVIDIKEQDINTTKEFADAHGRFNGKNILIIVIESGAAENFSSLSPSKFQMPFFDSLKSHSLYFSNAYANAYLSTDGIKAILAGMGNYIPDVRSKHPYIKNRPMMAEILAQHNYTTSFYYSNKNADYWKEVGFAGITNYFNSASDTENTTDHDHLFFLSVAKRLENVQEPFLTGIANRATHNPFDRFPDYYTYKKKYPIFEQAASMAYFDDVLKSFFNTIQQYSWFENTVFIFVADHTSRATDLSNRSDWGLLQIPVMIYDPQGSVKGVADYPVQQTDIPANIINLLGFSDINASGSSNSLLGGDISNKNVLTRKGNELLFATDSLFLRFDLIKQEPTGCWNYRTDPYLKKELPTDTLLMHQFYHHLHEVKKQYRTVAK